MNLILIEADEVAPDGGVTLHDVRAAHITTVLRAVPGQSVRIGIVDGPLGTGAVASVGPDGVRLACTFESTTPPSAPLDLLLALPRPKVLRRLWSQLAALGVHRILLTNAERVERNYFDTHVLEERCYRPLLVEGLQQARDTRVPIVSVHRQLKVLVEDQLDGMAGDSLRLVADHRAAVPAVDAARRHEGRVLLAVGPEGGWNDFELTLFESHGFTPVGIGSRTLRVDTACVAVIAAVQAGMNASGASGLGTMRA